MDLFLDDDNLTLDDHFMDFQDIDSNFDYTIDVESNFYMNTPLCSNPINPDDFLTGIKTEIKSEPPSSDYGSNSSGSPVSNILMQPMDTPPQSPPVLLSPLPADSKFQILQLANTAQQSTQGHLIPITLPSSKKIQIQPANGPAQPKRTIVLPPKDFQMLMEKMKNTEQNKYIMVKNVAQQIKPKVLPKVLPKPIVPIVPNTNRAIIPKSPPSQNQSSDSDCSVKTNFTSVSQARSQIDPKTIKKQERMIKNRESAFQSRKKRKEYVSSLESQVNELQKENSQLKGENFELKQKLGQLGQLGLLTGSRGISSITQNISKNTAMLLAMVFMVSINLGPISNMLSSSISSRPTSVASDYNSRHLLFINESELGNNSSLDIEFPQILNGTKSTKKNYPICPMFINQTENIRLASDLRRWIREPEYKNSTNQLDLNFEEFEALKPIQDHLISIYAKSKNMRGNKKKKLRNQNSKIKNEKNGPIQLYDPSSSNIRYAEFFEEIGRRDDTFYVVSFTGEHLLLPAVFYNKTNRPKMSLMLPVFNNDSQTDSGFLTLMQIDCELLNTSLIRVKENSVPDDFKDTKKAPSKPVQRKGTAETSDNLYDSEIKGRSTRESNVTANNTLIDLMNQNMRRYPKNHPQFKPYFVENKKMP